MLTLNALISEFPGILVEFFALVGYSETSIGLSLAFIIIIIIIIIIKVQEFFWKSWPLKIGPIRRAETSVIIQLTLRNNENR